MSRSGPQSDRDTALLRLAARTEWVVSLEQLYRVGFSVSDVRVRVRRGQWHRVHDGVYAIGPPALTVRGRLHAALLAAPPEAFLSHRTAVSFWRLAPLDPGPLHVTVPGDWTRPPRATGLVFHRTTSQVDGAEVVRRDGLRVATVARSLLDLSAQATDAELERLLTEAVRRGVFDPHLLERMLQRHRRRPGVGRLARIADYYRPQPDRKSEFERSWDIEHARRPELPPCERNAMVHGWEIDCWWPEQRLALELDGRPYHSAQRDFEKDRRKDTALHLLRITPMRVTWWMWQRDREQTIDNVLALIALADGDADPRGR